MSVGRKARRERISAAFDTFHATVRDLLTAATRLSEGAARERAETMVELWLRLEGLESARTDPGLQGVLANPRVASAVDRVAADEVAAFDEWLADGPDRLVDLMHRHAPATAGAEQGWLPREGAVSEREGPDGVPRLWRIGTGAVGAGDGSGALPAPGAARFPVGVPLLDESHLQVDALRTVGSEAERGARRAAAEALVEALVLRAVGYFRPGLVYVHVWDIGQLTGSLPGLYPLTRTGLLTVHDPGNLEGCSTSWPTGSAGCTPASSSTATRRCRFWRGRRISGPSRGSSLCSSATARRSRTRSWSSGCSAAGCLRDLPRARRRADDHRCAAGDGAAALGTRRHGPLHRRRHLDDRASRHRRARPAAAPQGRDRRLPGHR